MPLSLIHISDGRLFLLLDSLGGELLEGGGHYINVPSLAEDKIAGRLNGNVLLERKVQTLSLIHIFIGLVAGALLKLAVYVKGKNRKKFRQGEEYGSARWGKPEDIKPYTDPEFSNNIILTQTEMCIRDSCRSVRGAWSCG